MSCIQPLNVSHACTNWEHQTRHDRQLLPHGAAAMHVPLAMLDGSKLNSLKPCASLPYFESSHNCGT